MLGSSGDVRGRRSSLREAIGAGWASVVTKAKWILMVALAFTLAAPGATARRRKDQQQSYVSSSDPTARLYQLLDNSFGGKLKDFYVAGDVYPDSNHPGSSLQHFLRVEYDKNLFFGRLQIYVRSVGQPTADQLKTYTTKQLYDFGEIDTEEFEKIDSGPFGDTGDLYLAVKDENGPLTPASITQKISDEYDTLVSQYILPALEKEAKHNSK